MNAKWLSIALLIGALACGNEEPIDLPGDGSLGSPIRSDDGRKKFERVKSAVSGDDFELLSAALFENHIEVRVAYPGGCQHHSFELVWKMSDETDMTEVVIIHENNGDSCEAYLEETLTIEIDKAAAAANTLKKNRTLRVINASNLKSVVIYKGLPSFTEGETCELAVTAEDVICGDGLFENRWLRYASTEDGMPVYLQPVSLSSLMLLSGKIEPGEYLVGVKVSDPFVSDPDKVICLAYPGPSVPVTIWCIEAK